MQASFFLIETKDSTPYPCTLNARNVGEIQQPLKGCSSSGLVTRVPFPVAPVKAGEWTLQSCFLTCTHVPVSPPHIAHAWFMLTCAFIHTHAQTCACSPPIHMYTHVHTRMFSHTMVPMSETTFQSFLLRCDPEAQTQDIRLPQQALWPASHTSEFFIIACFCVQPWDLVHAG